MLLLVVGAGLYLLVFGDGMSTTAVAVVASVFLVILILLLMFQSVVDLTINEAVSLATFVNNERFNSLYGSSPIPYITIDNTGQVIMFNPAAVRLLHGTIEQLRNLNLFDIVLEHVGHDLAVLASKVQSGVVINDEELRLKTYDGSEVWTLVSVYEDKDHKRHIFSLLDITQAKKIDTAKSEFVALATHQLRTPIAAIRFNYELLSKKLPDSLRVDFNKYLAKIGRNVNRMNALIDDFLSVSKLEMGTYATAEERIDLSVFFSEILDEFSERIEQKQIHVSRSDEPEGFVFVTDPGLLHIIVSNLTSNAVKYLKQGGSLSLSFAVADNTLIIEVSDNGIGIPENEQAELFNKFFRASNARTHQTEGTGLGLYIVKQSAEQLGGTIEVASVPDEQTTFRVLLPVRTTQ